MEIKKQNLLLSICIPTYNRADVLDKTLRSLFLNPEFDSEKVEVIVSDNCSTDNTIEIIAKYPLVRYYRNDINVIDKNFNIVLSYARGDYIRLFNDTLSFKTDALKFMLKKIKLHLDTDVNLFFYNNMFINTDCVKEVRTIEGFIKEVSFFNTWIANFGVWRKDFEIIKDRDRYSELKFVQVDWTFKLVENGIHSLVYFNDFFESASLNSKGGYNVFDTFINKYLFIVEQQKLPFFIYKIEKYRLFRYFVYQWLLTLFVKDKENYAFDTKGVNLVILKKYWYEPYIYPLLLLFWVKKILK
tara:strand:+ start:5654 stop:6553 length:900 start_codon:yes stop_codon:yes gene_type:complete